MTSTFLAVAGGRTHVLHAVRVKPLTTGLPASGSIVVPIRASSDGSQWLFPMFSKFCWITPCFTYPIYLNPRFFFFSGQFLSLRIAILFVLQPQDLQSSPVIGIHSKTLTPSYLLYYQLNSCCVVIKYIAAAVKVGSVLRYRTKSCVTKSFAHATIAIVLSTLCLLGFM